MIIDKKCTCGSKSTGDTTIRCCNLCGLPLQNEPWHFNLEENIFSRVDAEVIVKTADRGTIETIRETLIDLHSVDKLDDMKYQLELIIRDLEIELQIDPDSRFAE